MKLIKNIRYGLSDLFLRLALKVLPKNSGEQMLLAMALKRYVDSVKKQKSL